MQAPAWQAVGRADQDLPSWVAQHLEHGLTVSSGKVDVQQCTGADLEQRAHQLYRHVLGALKAPPTRVWTFLPGITSACPDGLDRYMHLNIGRARAYQDANPGWGAMPAGTCVGHQGPLLVIHAVAAGPGWTPLENPRQRPAWEYSQRFGPVAPPFSRGVRVGQFIWASGTASVVGESTVHPGNMEAQWAETVANLEALRSSAGATGRWQSLRAYVRDASSMALVSQLGRAAFGEELREIVHASLCRADLLVEVEGIAHV